MFMAALFIITTNWKQPTCPSLNEWLNKLWYIHNGLLISYIQPTWLNL